MFVMLSGASKEITNGNNSLPNAFGKTNERMNMARHGKRFMGRMKKRKGKIIVIEFDFAVNLSCGNCENCKVSMSHERGGVSPPVLSVFGRTHRMANAHPLFFAQPSDCGSDCSFVTPAFAGMTNGGMWNRFRDDLQYSKHHSL
jgi:hypothetical protein